MKKIILSLIMTASICFANNDATTNLISKLTNIHSMSANFTQKLIDNQSDSHNSSKGFMRLKKPYFFKWIMQSPNTKKIISNGKKLWIYDEDLEQLIIKKVSNNITQLPYLILLSENIDNINNLFNVREKNTNTYILEPKNDEIINNIVIQFIKDNQLNYLQISTSLHQHTQIQFSNIAINSNKIKDSEFKFIAPDNTDIIDETKINP